MAVLLSTQTMPPGPRVGVVTNAGGPGILLADMGETHGLVLPELMPETQAALRTVLPPQAGVANPVDIFSGQKLLVIAILTVANDFRLLLMVAPVVLCIHLWQTVQMRNRLERASWQQLAKSIDELNAVDLPAVLHSAVVRAAALFSVEEVEIAIRLNGTDKLVRGTVTSVTDNEGDHPWRAAARAISARGGSAPATP